MDLRLLRHGLRTSIVNNASAYGYSVAITLSLVATQRTLGGPATGELLLFAVGAALGFAVIEAVAVEAVRGKVPTDPSDVVVLGGAFAMMSVTATVAVAIGVSRLVPGSIGWLSTAFVATSAYVVLSGLEMALARRSQEHPEDAPEEPTDPP